MTLTQYQRQIIDNLPPGCRFYQEDSLTGDSRTIRIRVPCENSVYLLYVKYEGDFEGKKFNRILEIVRLQYNHNQTDEYIIDIPY